jgi:Lrp/AsnC family transcriptional regulator for asnA, asnC and gidA
MSKFRLDEVDHQILDMLIDNTRVPFTDIAKKLLILQVQFMLGLKDGGW